MSKDRLYHSFVQSFLKENYPSILDEVIKNYQGNDLDRIEDLIAYFYSYHNIKGYNIFKTRSKGLNKQLKRKLVASIIYLYQPSKLNQVERLNESLAKKLKQITQYDSFSLTSAIKSACDDFSIYKTFRDSVKHFCNTYKLLK